LGAEQIHLEEDGGDVPSVKVSGLKGQGLDTLVETLGVLAEVRDLRASVEGRGEGWVLESRVERGRGNSATILVTRGTLHVGSVIIAGTTWCKIRQMLDDKNKPIKSAPPGTPVNITGWKDLPLAGDKILQPYNYGVGKGNKGEDEVKRAVANRIRDKERKALMNDVEVINEKRRIERERQVEEEARHEAIKAEGGDVSAAIRSEERRLKREEEERGKKELRLIIRADVSGTVEAVVGALEGIGNNEVGVKIIHTDVGDVSDSDVAMAEASDGESRLVKEGARSWSNYVRD
jgi:translation initiation factor IF-2